jgi:hypothetical protein
MKDYEDDENEKFARRVIELRMVGNTKIEYDLLTRYS